MTRPGHVTELVCVVCAASYDPQPGRYVCDGHGGTGTLDVRYDYGRVGVDLSPDSLAADPTPTMWRYRPLLPVAADTVPPPPTVGWTPLYDAPRLASVLGVARVWVKDEGRQPSASLKDRASTMAVAKAREFGAATVTTASTGNAAAALSGMAASVGMDNVIFVPEAAPPAKVAQLLAYGSMVVLVEGTYTDAFDLCMEAAATYGWYNRNTGFNPYMTEGKKTAMLEILEQSAWRLPDAVFVGVGDGSIIGGLHKALRDAAALGWISDVPRLFGVQAAGSDYMVQAFESGEDVAAKPPIAASTIADSISADLPRDRIKAMAAVVETGGAFIRVDDEEILAAVAELARGAAVFAEPAGAAPLAGARRAVEKGLVGAGDRLVLLATGSGLKDVAAAMKAVAGNPPLHVPPEMAALEAALNTRKAPP